MVLKWGKQDVQAKEVSYNNTNLHDKSSGDCITTRSAAASQPFIGEVAEQKTVKWPIRAVCEARSFC